MRIMALAAASILALGGASAAMAESASLDLSGKVPEICGVNINAGTSGSVTIGSNTSQHGLGSANIACNLANGFEIKVTTSNEFNLKSGTYAVPYSFRIDNPIQKTFGVGDNAFQKSGFDADIAKGVTSQLYFSPTNPSTHTIPGGTVLEDTVTITIGAPNTGV